MKTVLIACGGTYGDLKPFLALAHALQARQVRPLLLVNPAEKAHIEKAGLEARWVGKPVDVKQLIRDNPKYMGLRGGPAVLKELYIPLSEELYRATDLAILEEKPAACIVHFGCFGSLWAAQQHGVPLANVHLAPVLMGAADKDGVYPWYLRLPMRLLLPLVMRAASGWMKPLCRNLGHPWHRHIFRESLTGGDLLLGLWSNRFRKASPRDPDRLRTCGFPKYDARFHVMPAGLSSFLEEGPPPIAIGFGSGATEIAQPLFQTAARVCKDLGLRAVLLNGGRPLEDLPPALTTAGFASYRDLFPRCRAIVHHAGIGTTADVLHSGRPSVAVPFAHDQFDNALRMQSLGTAQMVPRIHFSARRFRKALERILHPSFAENARSMAEHFRSEPDGLALAAEQVLQQL